jgi:hypothetical protein
MLNLAPTTWAPNSGQCIVGMQSATRKCQSEQRKIRVLFLVLKVDGREGVYGKPWSFKLSPSGSGGT